MLTWKVEPAPTGLYKSFEKRGWPSAFFKNSGRAAAIISADCPYVSSKQLPTSPLKVRIAFYHSPEERILGKGAWTWRTLKAEFSTLDEAKAAAEKFLKNHPEYYASILSTPAKTS